MPRSIALGVNPEYAEFMMGNKGALYNDIKMKGPEFLRNIYRAAGLSVRQKTKTSRLELLKELVRGFAWILRRSWSRRRWSKPTGELSLGRTASNSQVRTLRTHVKKSILSELRTGDRPSE